MAKKVPRELNEYDKRKSELSIVEGIILFRDRVVVPKKLEDRVISLLHDNHPGIPAAKSIARSLVCFKDLDNRVETYCRNCVTCLMNHARSNVCYDKAWPQCTKKWSRLHIDHCFTEGRTLFVVVCAATKYIECAIVNSVSTNDTIKALDVFFSNNGLPDTIVSDNATSFTSEMFLNYAKQRCIQLITTPAYSPNSNAYGERSVRVIKDQLKKNTSGSFESRLSRILLHYRSTPHSTTGVAPSVALNGREYCTIKHRINPKYVHEKFKLDDGNIAKKFVIGSMVLAINFHSGPKWLEAEIVKRLGSNVFSVILLANNVVVKRHALSSCC